MATLVENGFVITQRLNHDVVISRNGRDVLRFAFTRELTGEELSELVFWYRSI